MKFQLKAIAAAVVLAAAVPAQAELALGASGNSSLTIAVFDAAAGVGALFDLGKNYSDFSKIGTSFANSNVDAEGTNFSWDLTSGDYATAWSTFAGLTNSTNWQFAVMAIDNAGTGVGARGVVSTLSQESVSNVTTSGLGNLITNWDKYLVGASVANSVVFQNHGNDFNPTGIANGASVGSGAPNEGNVANYFIFDKPFNTGSKVVGNVGQSLAVFQYATTSGLSQATSTVFGNNAAFTFTANGALTYTTNDIVAEVPEADTWAMMLLGLGFMGFAARRKQA